MSDKDSTTSEETKGKATPEGLDSEVRSAGSEQEFVTREDFDKIAGTLDAIARQIQSDKDRAVKRTNERLEVLEGSIKDVLSQAKSKGQSIEDLLGDIESAEERKFKQDLAEAMNILKNGQTGNPSVGSESGSGVDVSKVLNALELDMHDPRVAQLAGQKFNSEAEVAIAAAKLVKKIASTLPDEADLPSPESRRAQSSGKQEQLMAEYKEGSKNLYGKQLINFKMDMIRKGLNIS